jgi:hypothetical protein
MISVRTMTTTVGRNVLVSLIDTGNLAAVTINSYLSIMVLRQFNFEGTYKVGLICVEFDFSMMRYERLGVCRVRTKTELSLMSITKTRGVETPS